MARKRRSSNPSDLQNVRGALTLLQFARAYLRQAGAPKAAAYVSRAIKSAAGAERHILRTLPFEFEKSEATE